MATKLTDEQIYHYLLKELDESYNVNFNLFRFALGVRHHAPFDKDFMAVESSDNGVTWIEFSEVPQSVFNQLCPTSELVQTRRERGWNFSHSKSYDRAEIGEMFFKHTRKGIISDLLLNIENEVV